MSPLEKILRKHFEFEDRFNEEKFSQAVQGILALIRENVKCDCNSPSFQDISLGCVCGADVYNKALAEVRRAMEGDDEKA